MAKQTSDFQPVGFNNAAVLFQAADTTTIKDIMAAGANDSVITSIVLTSASASLENVQLLLHDGTNSHVLNTIRIPSGSGTNGTSPPVDGLSAAWLPLSSGKRVLSLKTGWKLQARMKATASGDIEVFATGQDY